MPPDAVGCGPEHDRHGERKSVPIFSSFSSFFSTDHFTCFILYRNMPPSVKDVLAILDDLPSDISETERWQLTDALRSKLHLLQTPFERSWEMTLASPLVYSAIKTLLNLGLWETWRTAEGEEKSVDELVELCGGKCEANLLR